MKWVPVLSMTGLAFARALVVARTYPHPGGQALGAAEGPYVRADFHQQHSRADLIDTGQGLQQVQLRLPRLQGAQQIRVHVGDALHDGLDVLHCTIPVATNAWVALNCSVLKASNNSSRLA